MEQGDNNQGIGDIKVTWADGETPYQPDVVVLGDAIGAKIGSLVLVWKEGKSE
jgi:hypothetical protein